MKLVIDRSKWLRGMRNGDGTTTDRSFLLNVSGSMCCLGFLAVQSGARVGQIMNETSPGSVADCTINWPPGILDIDSRNNRPSNTLLCSDLMDINDNICISDGFREGALIQKFSEIGVEVVFEGPALIES